MDNSSLVKAFKLLLFVLRLNGVISKVAEDEILDVLARKGGE